MAAPRPVGTVADDLDSVTSSLGVTNNAATSLSETLAGLGVASAATGASVANLDVIMKAQAATMAAYEQAAASAAAREKDVAARNATRDKAVSEQIAEQAAKQKELADAYRHSSGEAFASAAVTQGLTAAMGPYGQAVDIVIQRVTWLASKLYDLAAAAVALTQEKDAIRATFDVFTGGAGDDLLGTLEALSSELPFTADALNAWAKGLLAAGISGDALNTSLRAVAASTAIMGEAGGQAALGLIKRFAMMAEAGQKVSLDRRILTQLAQAGVSIQALAAALGVAPDKLGEMKIAASDLGAAMQKALIQQGTKPLAIMGQTWASISAKLKEGFEDAFEDLGDIVGPFMGELRSLASEFFAGSIASGVLKDGIRGLLTPAFEVATKAVRGMHIAFLMAEIAYLKATIALRPVSDFLGSIATRAQWLEAVMYVLTGAGLALAIVFGVLAVAVFLVALPFIVAAAAIVLLVIGLIKLAGVIDGAISNLDNIGNKVSETGENIVTSVMAMVSGTASALVSFPLAAAQAGVNFVTGLIQAITSGQGPVADAVRQLARGAISAITGAFQTRSPSRVTAKIGGYFTEGLAGGIDDGAGDVEAAAGGAGDAAVGGLKSGMRKGSGGGGRGGGRGKIAEMIQFIYQGPADQFDDFAEKAEAWLEKMAAEGPDPEPAS